MKLNRCIDLMSRDAAALFGLEMGRIKVGVSADLVLFDLENEFELTADYFASKSKNSPFIGQKLLGRTKLILFEGKIVFEDNL